MSLTKLTENKMSLYVGGLICSLIGGYFCLLTILLDGTGMFGGQVTDGAGLDSHQPWKIFQILS
jgi:hypothetical protein